MRTAIFFLAVAFLHLFAYHAHAGSPFGGLGWLMIFPLIVCVLQDINELIS